MTKANKEKIIKALIDKAETEVIQQQVMIDFYEEVIKTAEGELANSYKTKQAQMKSTLAFNQKFIDYVKSL